MTLGNLHKPLRHCLPTSVFFPHVMHIAFGCERSCWIFAGPGMVCVLLFASLSSIWKLGQGYGSLEADKW